MPLSKSRLTRLASLFNRHVAFLALGAIAVAASTSNRAAAVDWLGGTGNWSDDLFWSSGFVPDAGEDVWVNAPGGSTINFDVASATVREFRLGNGEDNQVLNIPAGTLTITAEDGAPSWSGRWSVNTTTRISGSGSIVVSNLLQKGSPFFIAGDQGPGGDQGYTQNAQFIVEGNGSLIIEGGGAPLDGEGFATAGDLSTAWWREAVANVEVKGNGLIDIARDLVGNSGEFNLTQSGGVINVGRNFYLDRYDAVDGQNNPAASTATITGGQFNVGKDFHVTEAGQGAITVAGSGVVNITGTLKINAVSTGGDGDGVLRIIDGGVVETQFLEVPTSAQLLGDRQSLEVRGGLLVIRNAAVETNPDTAPIADSVSSWIASGYLSGGLSTGVNYNPGITPDGVIGEIAYARDPSTGFLNIWNVAEVAPLAGDYNFDGKVDAADYTVWRDTSGQSGAGLPADGNGDGTVNEADYLLWTSNYGATAQFSGAVSVPEPTCVCIALLAAALSTTLRARR